MKALLLISVGLAIVICVPGAFGLSLSVLYIGVVAAVIFVVLWLLWIFILCGGLPIVLWTALAITVVAVLVSMIVRSQGYKRWRTVRSTSIRKPPGRNDPIFTSYWPEELSLFAGGIAIGYNLIQYPQQALSDTLTAGFAGALSVWLVVRFYASFFGAHRWPDEPLRQAPPLVQQALPAPTPLPTSRTVTVGLLALRIASCAIPVAIGTFLVGGFAFAAVILILRLSGLL